jgi:hypothetical protein
MADGWIDPSRRAVVALADAGTWGYRRGASPAVEATALAALGLLATATGVDDPARGLIVRSADALAGLQRPDGSLGVGPALPSPGWATPYALLLWQALGTHHEARRRAAAWLLAERVDTPPRSADPDRLLGHDSTIPGWPWVEGTHSWVEPTAMAVLTLGREGHLEHPRVVDGVRLLVDRAIGSGGWNYGNNVVYGRSLRSQPGPTGLTLLALARAGSVTGIDQAAVYLRSALPGLRAASSLGWGLLGLRAWGAAPAVSGGWLAESAARVIGRDDAATRLGLLLLAAGDRRLDLFGLDPARSLTP